MKRYLIYMLLIAAGMFTSCEDFLDESPKYALTLENAVTDYEGAKNVVNGIYSVIRKESNLGGDLQMKLASQSGITQFSDTHYSMSYREGGYDDSGSTWLSFYRLINATNAAITGIANLPENVFPKPEDKQVLLSEARTIRGWAYAQILMLWGHWWEPDDCEYGIIFRDQMATLNNLQVPRLTVGESYRKVFEDLDEGIKNLPDFTTPRYFSKQMAQVIKAKVLLNRGVMRNSEEDLREALAIVEDVRANSPAEWTIEPDMEAMYADGWDTKEGLFSRYLGDDEKLDDWIEFTYSYSLGSSYLALNDKFEDWLMDDPREKAVMDTVRAPEVWDNDSVYTVEKLYHGGRFADPNGKYTTYYFRKPELYLMESELRARLNQGLAAALKPLNEMRAMRTFPKLPALEAKDMDEFMAMLFKEICLETFFENGGEYYASLRFINTTEKGQFMGKPWIYTLKERAKFGPDQYCWPIPKDERAKNELAVQNPGLGSSEEDNN